MLGEGQLVARFSEKVIVFRPPFSDSGFGAARAPWDWIEGDGGKHLSDEDILSSRG